jgi:hypothetical protein
MEKEKIELDILREVYKRGDFEWVYYKIKELENAELTKSKTKMVDAKEETRSKTSG